MKKIDVILGALILAVTIAAFPAYADTFSCEGGIISTGDRNTDVMAKCGRPDFRNSYEEEVSRRLDRDIKQKIYILVEEWTYNLGPNQLTRIVVLHNGVVHQIRTGSYGYNE